MKIAFLSALNPTDIHAWSGTLYHMFHALQENHEVEWIGGEVFQEKMQLHGMQNPRSRFLPELHVEYWAVMLEDFFCHHHYDVIVARDYYFIAYLKTYIPIVYVGDTTLDLMKDYLHLPKHFAALADKLECAAIANASKVVYSSEWAAKNAIEHYGADEEKIHVVEFGANITTKQGEVVLPKYQAICQLLFVAKAWKLKGGDKVLAAYRALRQRDFPCHLTLIGIHPETLPEDVTTIGLLDKANPSDVALLKEAYQKANFFFMPSTFDCFGIVYAEGASFGVPSLATRVGGVSQVVREDVNGLLFEADSSAEEMADRIIALYNDRQRYERLCQSALQDAQTRLNWKVWGEKLEAILCSVVATNCNNILPKIREALPTFIINCKKRKERKAHIIKEFEGRNEFNVHIIEACEHPNGAIGLWQSICKIVLRAKQEHLDTILICEDDHCFTPHYNKEYLFSNIHQARRQGALLLNGGIGGFGAAVRVSAHRYWIDWFWSTQFIVIFAPLFDVILDYDFKETDTADGVFSKIVTAKMALYPFISVQKSFGYSDVSESNDSHPERVEAYFEKSSKRLGYLHTVSQHFLQKI